MTRFQKSVISGLFTALAFASGALRAQTLDTGTVRGRVTDVKGGPLPGVLVRARGPQGQKTTETDGNGNYSLPYLTPGTYELTVTLDGFSTQVQSGIAVNPQQTSLLSFRMNEGTDIVIVRSNSKIDVTSSTSTTRIDVATAVNKFAQVREFSAIFDFSPGVNTDAGVGGGNYSISGASGMENQYLVNGMNITGAGFGTLGAYDQFRGATGVGLTTSFFDTVDVREGGFEAEYGGALGGVISANLKAGGNDFHGNVEAYYTPRSLEGARSVLNDRGGVSNYYGNNTLDVSLGLSGPIIKDRLFFFVGYNPTWVEDTYRLDISQADLAAAEIDAPNANRYYTLGNKRSDNFVSRITWNMSPKQKLDLSYLTSPQTVNNGNLRGIGRRVYASGDPGLPAGIPDVDPKSAVSGDLKMRDSTLGLRYFATPFTWLNIEAQVSRHHTQVSERPGAGADGLRYNDFRRSDVFTSQQFNRGNPAFTIPAQPIVTPATFSTGGLGYYQEGLNDETTEYVLKVTHLFNLAGSHELKWGVDFGTLKYREFVTASGPKPTVYLKQLAGNPDPDSYVTLSSGVTASIFCDNLDPSQFTFSQACPDTLFRVSTATLNPPPSDTVSKERNYFIQDRWTIGRWTLNLGARYTSETISNHDSFKILSTTGVPIAGLQPEYVGKSYDFKGEIAPRLGVAWDVFGNGKHKLYGNYSRLYERVPNDLAVRSFGNEVLVNRLRFQNPDLTGQSNGQAGNPMPGLFGSTSTRVEPGTRLPYKDDYTLGYAFQIAPNFMLDIRANYRTQGRVLEDTQTATIEAIQNFYYSPYLGYCTNCTGVTEFFPGAGYAPFGEYVLANVGENSPHYFTDAVTGEQRYVDFGKPVSNYQALTFTLQKIANEGEHVSLFATYRISKLNGNYEGLFRNDNGQSDPNITSLFDFPDSPLAHTLYQNGRLNTDSPHSLRLRMAYDDMIFKNLDASLSFKWQSGSLRTSYLAHPVYQNGGELPGAHPEYYYFSFAGGGPGGYVDYAILKNYEAVKRGNLGRNPDQAQWDGKLSYSWSLGKSTLDFSLLVENIFNSNDGLKFDDNLDDPTGLVNPTYGLPYDFQEPRRIRLGVAWSF